MRIAIALFIGLGMASCQNTNERHPDQPTAQAAESTSAAPARPNRSPTEMADLGVVAPTTSRPPATASAASPAPPPQQAPPPSGQNDDLPMAGPTSDAGFRAPAPIGQGMFDPLDLPAANSVRTGSGAPGPDYWQQRVDYRIDATLDDEARRVTGLAHVTYHNNSPDTLTYIWLHLEQNLFKEGSDGALSGVRGSRFGFREGFEGGYRITRCSASRDGRDLNLATYDTMGRLNLPAPLEPGQTFEFDVGWSFNIAPYGADRMGTEDVEQGVVFELAQWFPAVAVYDDVYGWNTLPYLGTGEFYTNFGNFDLNITAPRDHIVVASGRLVNPGDVLTPAQAAAFATALESDETVTIRSAEEVADPASRPQGAEALTWRFRAEDVRTVAWASSESFIWDAAGVTVERAEGPARVLCQSVYPKEGLPLWADNVQMTRHTIRFYSDLLYPYPYPAATNVNGIVGGMEYPSIVFCRGRRNERGLFGVTDHEFGHQWFPMLVNTDERRHVWMDEGFNTFINIYSNRAFFNEPGEFRGSRSITGTADSMTQGQQQPIMTPTDHIWQGRLGFLGYGKPGVGLYILRESILGPERFDFAFREYVRRWAFKSPRPADFFRTMEDASGMDLAWFWRGWFLTTATLDQAIAGVDEAPDGSWVRLSLENRSDMVMPVDYAVTYADGSTDRRRLPVQAWSTTNAWTTGWNPEGKQVQSVVLDPDEAYPDQDRSNNTWTR